MKLPKEEFKNIIIFIGFCSWIIGLLLLVVYFAQGFNLLKI